MDEILRKTLHLVFSSKRRMPAHFTQDRDRKKSFCIDFEPLTAEDEYEMASDSYYSIDGYFSGKTEISKEQLNAVIRCGEDIMVGAFIISKLGRKDLVGEMGKAVISDMIETYEKEIESLKEILSFEEASNYFKHCAEFGKTRAEV